MGVRRGCPVNRGQWGPPLESGMWLTPGTCHSPCVNIPKFVAVGQTIWVYVGSQKFWGCWGPPPWDVGVADS